jgi:hypothetical protein
MFQHQGWTIYEPAYIPDNFSSLISQADCDFQTQKNYELIKQFKRQALNEGTGHATLHTNPTHEKKRLRQLTEIALKN